MTRADGLVIACACAWLGASYAALWQPPEVAHWVEVRSGGTLAGRYPLNQDRDLDVMGRQGPIHLRIAAGRVRFIASPCRNQVCLHAGWQSHAGDAAACLPGRVSLRLSGGDGSDAVDAIAN